MSIYPTILEKIILPIADRLVGTMYKEQFKTFSRLDSASREDIVLWQNKKLQALITHVYQNVPFYTEYMNNNNISPSDIHSAEDLDKFPIIDKQLIKERFKEFIPKNINQLKYRIVSTGGSSGAPLKYYQSNGMQSAMWAKRTCVLKKYNIQLGEKYLTLGSSSIIPNSKTSFKTSVFHNLIGMIPLNAANMDANKCQVAIALLQKKKIKVVYGYASAIYLLAKYVLDNKIDLPLKGCISTSEKLTKQYEEVIKKAFGCVMINEYGARDAGICSYRCEKGNFHMIESCLYRLEKGAKTGPILTTNLINYAMPFINYDVGDIITTHQNVCGCGSNSFVFEDVVGRASQIMTLGNGRTVTGPAFTVLFSGLPVQYYQIAKNGDCSIEVRIQRTNEYNEDTERTILNSLKTQAGEDCKITFNYDYEFKLLKSGKRDYFVA